LARSERPAIAGWKQSGGFLRSRRLHKTLYGCGI
jgi:hypothetical protein